MPDALIWGLKSSLVAYVRSQSDGSVETTDGAKSDPTGVFRFPYAGRDGDVLRYQGGVRLRAHGGMLDVAISAPWVELAPTPSISAAVEWTDDPGERLTIVRMDVAEAEDGAWTGTSVQLTSDGALTLGAMQYYEGQQIDDASFTAPAA